MKIVYLGAKQAGCIGLLTLMANGHEILGVVAYDDMMELLCNQYKLKQYNSINNWRLAKPCELADLLVCVHGRELVPIERFGDAYFGGINVRPCLYKYKGASPIAQLLAEGEAIASVGVHRMTTQIGVGEVLVEIKVDVSECKTEIEVYNKLYVYYSIAILKALINL